MILKKLEFLQTIVQKYSNTKFHENMPSGNRVVPYGEADGQTDMTKLAAFHNFAHRTKNV